MKRLAPLLESTDGEVGFELHFSLDEERRPKLALRTQARLPLRCQASLEVYEHPVARSSVLAVIQDEAEIPLLTPDLEPVQAEKGRIAVAELVEDELLLGLPEVPRKPNLESVRYSTGSEEDEPTPGASANRPNPFAVLKGQLGPEDGK
ncbi:MAG: YceD family protein [Pseudomonadota bacterium]